MPDKNPIVSIIIPNYNHAQYLGDAISSVLNQTYTDFEVIVVDDGSKDNSREVIERFGDRVCAIYQQNSGLSAARNTGIQKARGSLIGVLDADDAYEPVFLETLVDILESNPHADGIYCGYQFIDEKNQLLPQMENRAVPSDALYTSLLDGNFFVPESILVRRHCYDMCGLFDETLRACEDWDMWLRFTKKFQIIHTPRILTRHRVLAGSMSADPLRMLTNRLAVLSKHAGSKLMNNSDPDDIKRRAYGRAYLAASVEYMQIGDWDRSYQCFQQMSNICPSLLVESDSFYQLGCGEQPKGFMGDLSSLDIRHNSATLLLMMRRLFADPGTSEAVKRYKRVSYAWAYFSLGLLAYGARELGQVRRFLALAVIATPKFIFNRRILKLWLKSLAGARLIDHLKSFCYNRKALYLE